MQYFLDGPVNARDKFLLSTQINGVLYILNSYPDAGGNPIIFFDSNVPEIVASGTDVPSVPVFSAVKAGNGVNVVTNSGGLSFDNSSKAQIRSTPAVLAPSQDIYTQPTDSIFLTGVNYTLNTTTGNAIIFDYGTSAGCTGAGATGGINSPCVAITGTITNIIALPLQWYFGCQGVNYNSSNTVAGSVCSAFCTISPNSPLCTDINNSLCTNYQSQGWTQLSDCKVGVPFNYCAVGKNCGDNNCNGACSSTLSTCTYHDGGFKCTQKKFEGIPWWGWVIIAVIVVIIFIAIIALFFRK